MPDHYLKSIAYCNHCNKKLKLGVYERCPKCGAIMYEESSTPSQTITESATSKQKRR